MMRNLNETLNEIIRITEWYRGIDSHIESSRKNIDALLKARRLLAANQVDLAYVVASAKEARDKAVFARKQSYSAKVIGHRENGLTVGESEHKANIETETHREIERGAEKAFEQAKLIYQSVNDILNAIAGDIRLLQYEYEKTNYRND